MKRLLTGICLLFVGFCFGQNAIQKTYFEYGDSVFYEGQRLVRWNILNDVTTVYNGFDTSPLDTFAAFVKKHPNLIIRVEVHSESLAPARYSVTPTYEKAKRITGYLIGKGVSKEKLMPAGYDNQHPINPCPKNVKCTEVERLKNRRIEFVILRTDALAYPLYINYNDTVFHAGQRILRRNILFDLSYPSVIPACTTMVDSLVDFIGRNPKLKIEIGVHCDSRWSTRFSEDLTFKRAQKLKEYVVSKGIDENRITAKGYNETQLLNRCVDGVKCSEEEHWVNRRVEFKILSTE